MFVFLKNALGDSDVSQSQDRRLLKKGHKYPIIRFFVCEVLTNA